MNNWLASYLIIAYVATTYVLLQHIGKVHDNLYGPICDSNNDTLCDPSRDLLFLTVGVLIIPPIGIFLAPFAIIIYVRDYFFTLIACTQ
jgi:hypothetical protein